MVHSLLASARMIVKARFLLVPCLLLATACRENSPSGPTVALDQEFTLAPGQVATLGQAGIHVAFGGVSGDSRCPADAVCIQGGDAIVHLRVLGGKAGDYELHTGDLARASITHAGVRIELVNLQPYPFSSRTIESEEYRATLRATR